MKGIKGAAMTTIDPVRQGERARDEFRYLVSSKRQKNNRKRAKFLTGAHRRVRIGVALQERGYIQEVNFALMNYGETPAERVKDKVMTRLEAARLNSMLKGSGYSWALCEKQGGTV